MADGQNERSPAESMRSKTVSKAYRKDVSRPRILVPASDDDLSQPTRRNQILREAAVLFREKGFDVTSMWDIADRVGISKPTLYHWFPNKNDIFIGIIEHACEQLCVRGERAISLSDVPERQLELFFKAHIGYIESDPTFCATASFGFAGLRDSPQRAAVVKWRDRHEANLRRILREGERRGTFRKLDVGMTSRAMFAALADVSRWWYKEGGSLSSKDIAAYYSELFLNGIRSQK